MSTSQLNDLSFLAEAAACMTSDSDIQKAFINTFAYLEQHFPIDGLVFQQYSLSLHSVKMLFLVQHGRFDAVEKIIPVLDEEKVELALRHRRGELIHNLPKTRKYPLADGHSQALSSYISYKARAYLICIVRSGERILGHLCLMGKHEECFTKEHEQKLALLHLPFSLIIDTLLECKQSTASQEPFGTDNKQIQESLNFLQSKKIIGEFTSLKETMDVVYQLQNREITALILGETGTGKELIANIIQQISKRNTAPFIKVNCGAIPVELIDSELFGYEKGAFTGATTSHPGRFEQAHGGTLFLDEIGELPLQAQVRLLRVLQNNVVERLGSTRSTPVDVRLILATNRNLEQMVQAGTFREDLYYRIYVFPITVPPLRDRTTSIPELTHFFLKNICNDLGIQAIPYVPYETFERLRTYSWPGNVRELENLVKRGLTLYRQGPLLLDTLLPKNEGWYTKNIEKHNDFEKNIDARVEAILEQRLAKLGLLQMPNALSQPSQARSSSEMLSSEMLSGEMLSGEMLSPEMLSPEARSLKILPKKARSLDETIYKAIEGALQMSKGKIHGVGGAAALLGINPNTLRSRMRKMGLLASFDK